MRISVLNEVVRRVYNICNMVADNIEITPKKRGRKPKSLKIEEDLDLDVNLSDLDASDIESLEKEKADEENLEDDIEEDEKRIIYFEENAAANVSQDPIRDYLRQIGQIPLLTQEQELKIAECAEIGLYAQWKLDNNPKLTKKQKEDLELLVKDGKRCRERLIEANLRLVVSMSRKYVGRGMKFSDIVQEGNSGLYRAADKFDYKTSWRFSTYASWWIRQAITRAIADQRNVIRLPSHIVDDINRMNKTRKALTVELERVPTNKEVADRMTEDELKKATEKGSKKKPKEYTEERIEDFIRWDRDPISTSAVFGEEGTTEVGDMIEDDSGPTQIDHVSQSFMRKNLDEVLRTLTDKEQEAITLSYGLLDGVCLNLDEVGRKMGISKERVRQLKEKSLAKLRHPTRAAKIKDFFRDAI